MCTDATSVSLAEQQAYYDARAAEYDQWWHRQGRYDHGPEANAAWITEGRTVSQALRRFPPSGHILELACGTGIWTGQLLPFATSLTAVDGSPSMLALNRARAGTDKVRYIQADLFTWEPDRRFDTVFFGFWLSHVPLERFEWFWDLVARCLAPGGRVFFVDSKNHPTSRATNHCPADTGSGTSRRQLNDGSQYTVYKIFYHPQALQKRLRTMGWQAEVRATERFFIHGWAVGGRR